jgi:hypothetical protein
LEKEWSRLRSIGCWDEAGVKEWRDVAGAARRAGETIHRGPVFAICVEKNADLPEDHPGRKYKGRVVFEGNYVRDQNWEAALFQELSSCPATMDAAKVADAYGPRAGHSVQQSDGTRAYTQAKLGGTKTWVGLPPEAWPAEWDGMMDPVVPLVLAL